MVPAWLSLLSWFSLALAIVCAALIAFDVARHPQKMWIMDIVWPVTALFGSVLSLWFYYRYGRLKAQDEVGEKEPDLPFPVMVAKGALHCGSGCTLGDIIAETLALVIPGLAVIFGLGWLFGEKIFAVWVFDFIVAFGIGVAFQYFTIAPMRGLGVKDGIIAAVKADTLSLTCWQIGMYGFMAIAHFWLFGALLGVKLEAGMAEFWFMMQIAMLAGFATAYPANWFLITKGLKEKM